MDSAAANFAPHDYPPPPPRTSQDHASVPLVSQQQLKEFHRIDRVLYARMVMDMGRGPEESMRVVAMCLLLERSKLVQNMVKTLLKSTDILINSLANEIILCMQCIYKDPADPFLTRSIQEIPLLTSITDRQISLPYFVENRNKVLEELARIMMDVCHRALDDLYRTVVGGVVAAQQPPLVLVPPQMYYGPPAAAAVASGSILQRGNASVPEQLEREPRGGYTAMLLSLDEATINDDTKGHRAIGKSAVGHC